MRFQWDGKAMVPVMGGVAKRQFETGETYLLEVRGERSSASHRYYFASLKEGWENLPDHLAAQFPSPEHLRAHLLIRTDYYNVRTITCSSRSEARRVASFVKPLDDYALVTTKDAIVNVFTARSQSTKAMAKKEFGESKTAVLDALSALIGVTTTELQANAGQAA